MRMKLAAVLLLLTFCFGTMLQADAGIYVDFNLFVGNMSPYGTWVYTPNYGEVWYPTSVGYGWRPYSYGHWAWTEYGWMWVSDEPWGWATYHYGRWTYDPDYGWVWVPGAVWAPAWVRWYVGTDYIGWAPLGPPGVSININVFPQAAVFVPFHAFLSDDLHHYWVPANRNITIIHNTTIINNVTVVHNTVINPGPRVTLVQQRIGRPVQMVHLVSAAHAPAGGRFNRVQGNQLAVFRPQVRPSAKFHTPMLRNEATKGIVQVGNRRLVVPHARVAPLQRTPQQRQPRFHPQQQQRQPRFHPQQQQRQPQFHPQQQQRQPQFHPQQQQRQPRFHPQQQQRQPQFHPQQQQRQPQFHPQQQQRQPQFHPQQQQRQPQQRQSPQQKKNKPNNNNGH